MSEEQLNMNDYPLHVYFSKEDNCYIALAPDIRGCMAHGDTAEEAIREVQQVLRICIDSIIEDGDKLPIPSKIG